MSEVILLDTHIWLWLINGNFEKFPSQWLDKIESADRVGVSPLSCYEIALAHDKGRILLPSTAQDWFRRALVPAGIELFPLNESIAACAIDLSPVHRDPFDRMIIATALEYDAKLASVDSLFPKYAELTDHLMT